MISTYPCPGPSAGKEPAQEKHAEFVLAFDRDRSRRLLVVPALFEEANRLRRLTVEVMRRLDAAGIDSFLPDLPGCNESLQALEDQTLESWRAAMATAAGHFKANHVLGIRGGSLLLPELTGWRYAPVKGANLLRQMLRARIIASREAGLAETQEGLLEAGANHSLELVGYRLSPALLSQLQAAQPAPGKDIPQDMIGGAGLWLRAEPDEDHLQADALAAIVSVGMTA